MSTPDYEIHRAVVVSSNISTGEAVVIVPALLGADQQVSVPTTGLTQTAGEWNVPSAGSSIFVAVSTDLSQFLWVTAVTAPTDSDIDFNDNVSIGGDLTVNNNLTVNNSVDIGNDLTVTDNVSIEGNLAVTGNITAGQNEIFPAGTIIATISSVASNGWLLLDGSSVTNANTAYPALWDVAPTSWKSGTTLNLPDMSDRSLEGQTTTTLGALGGSNTVTIGSANLPTHQHSIDHGHGNDIGASQDEHDHTAHHGHSHDITANQSQHRHSVDPPSTSVSVTVDNNALDMVYNTQSYSNTDYIATDTVNADYYNASDFGMAVSHVTQHAHTASGTVDIASFNSGYTDPVITVSGGVTDNNTLTTSGKTPDITMSGGVTDHTGSSGDGGFANSALTVTNAHLAVNFQIKAH